jgi:DEAD/DEAH box helicase domain-containing protein
MSYCVFDLEIASPISSHPDGWAAARRGDLGISVLCGWDSDNDLYRFFDSHNLSEGGEWLSTFDTVVGFNSQDFDIPCLAGVLKSTPLLKGHYDILQKVWGALDSKRFKGYGLDAICKRTLGFGKVGSGEHAPQLLADGRIAELYSYCLYDVYLTRLLFEHIMYDGFIIDVSGDKLCLEVPLDAATR